MKKLAQVLFAIAYILFAFSAHAQVRSADIVLTISPQYPRPNQNVTAAVSSFVTNLDKAHISWSVNNQEMSQGVGKKNFYFTTGNAGTTANITVMINTVDGQSLQKTAAIASANVDILWEAQDAYVPPFYKGKALAPSQGTFKVVAMPNLTNQSGRINMANLSYSWTKDGDIQPDSSGWGKNSYSFINSYLDKGNTVGVKVSDVTGTVNASTNISLATSSPQIVFYKNDPLLGTRWDTALTDGFAVSPAGETIVAEPYFFSQKNINSSELDFGWSINSTPVQTTNAKNILSVKPNEGQSGSAVIRLTVSNIPTLFQEAQKTLNVQF